MDGIVGNVRLPSDLATSMGHIGSLGQPEVRQTIDAALTKIVRSGRMAGTLVDTGNVERYTRMGVLRDVVTCGLMAPCRPSESASSRQSSRTTSG